MNFYSFNVERKKLFWLFTGTVKENSFLLMRVNCTPCKLYLFIANVSTASSKNAIVLYASIYISSSVSTRFFFNFHRLNVWKTNRINHFFFNKNVQCQTWQLFSWLASRRHKVNYLSLSIIFCGTSSSSRSVFKISFGSG